METEVLKMSDQLMQLQLTVERLEAVHRRLSHVVQNFGADDRPDYPPTPTEQAPGIYIFQRIGFYNMKLNSLVMDCDRLAGLLEQMTEPAVEVAKAPNSSIGSGARF